MTTVDIQWWTGLSLAQTRRAIADVGAEEVALDTGPGWLGRDWQPLSAAGVSLLPSLDPTPMGYKERTWFLEDLGPRLFDRNGNAGPTIWQDGRVVGGWAVAEGKVVTRLLLDADEGAVAERAGELTEWLAGEVVRSRFPTPLEKELLQG